MPPTKHHHRQNKKQARGFFQQANKDEILRPCKHYPLLLFFGFPHHHRLFKKIKQVKLKSSLLLTHSLHLHSQLHAIIKKQRANLKSSPDTLFLSFSAKMTLTSSQEGNLEESTKKFLSRWEIPLCRRRYHFP